MIVLEGRLDAGSHPGPYVCRSFAVPANTTRIDVRYRYDAGNILDIGLFDPTVGPFPSRTGFRGWSGSMRPGFFVARDGATPGYLPGELPPGSWQVVLGLARLAVSPCHYRIEIDLDDAPRPLAAVPAGRRIDVPGPGWYPGDLQSHSHHSDARGSLQELAAAARARGLAFLAATDHNTCSHHPLLAELSSPELLLVPGQEVTTYRGHANVWGADGWVDFRIRGEADLDTLVAHVHDRGGLFSVNHPKTAPDCIGCDWEYPVPAGSDCLEAWQGPWLFRNWESLARYDALLRQGRRVTLVGGSDRHQPGWPDPDPELLQVGSPTTWLYLEALSVAAVLTALRSGRACVSESPLGPRLEIGLDDAVMGSTYRASPAARASARAVVTGAAGRQLRWIGAAGVLRTVPIDRDDFDDRWSWRPEGLFLRAEVVGGEPPQLPAQIRERLGRSGWTLAAALGNRPYVRALSNPIYLA